MTPRAVLLIAALACTGLAGCKTEPAAMTRQSAHGELEPTGRVTDAAHILTAAEIRSLDDYLTGFEARSRHQMVVVTVPSWAARMWPPIR